MMIRLAVASGAALFLAAVAGATTAQQTQTYGYDVHGRLISVERTADSRQTSTYVLDKASNRTGRTVTAPASAQSAVVAEAKTQEPVVPQAPVPSSEAPEGSQ